MNRLTLQQWLQAKKGRAAAEVDNWYLQLSNRLKDLLPQLPLYNSWNHEQQLQAVLRTTLYLHDAVSQSGGWIHFKQAFQQTYAKKLPFYPISDEYVDDEINREDLAFLLWTVSSQPCDDRPATRPRIADPHQVELSASADILFTVLDEVFEQAPINEEAASGEWVPATHSLHIPQTALPVVDAHTQLSPHAERCLAYSNGHPLIYLEDYQALYRFFTEVLMWSGSPSALLPDLHERKGFVIYANAKGMLIGVDVAAYFNDPHNPYYDENRTEQEGYLMFCKPGICPFDLLKLGVHQGFLEKVKLPFPNGKEELHNNWDFIARYFLGPYYEGD